MSEKRRSRRKGAPAPPVTPRKSKSRRGGGARLALIIGALALAGAATWFAFARRGAGSNEGPVLGAAEALHQAQAAEKRGDYEAAFAIYRDAMRWHPGESVLVGAYAAAVSNRSFSVRPNRGRFVSLSPTSYDRVATALEVLALYDKAERLRPGDGEPALQRGLSYATWGLPEDALLELYKAHTLGGRQKEIDGVGATITLLQLGRGDIVDKKAIRPDAHAAP